MLIRRFERPDTGAVVALWEATGLTRPWNDPRKDIERKLEFQPDLFFVGVREGRVVASAMFGYDGHRGWLSYFAVAPAAQGMGLGRALLDHGEAALRALGCPKLNLQVRGDNAEGEAFWRRVGYGQDDVTSFGKRLIED